MRNVDKHIIHCSDSAFGDAEMIRQWHLERGFKDIGYHFVIRPDGEIEVGRMMNHVGAHCAKHNTKSIGTCLIGKESFTEKQFRSLRALHKMLKSFYPYIELCAHNQFNAYKTCPNFDVHQEVNRKK